MSTLLLLALALQSASQPAPAATLEFELVGGRVYVSAECNGHATTAILDTGAAASVMSLALADAWKLPTVGEVRAQGVGESAASGKVLSDVVVNAGGVKEPILYALPFGSLHEAEGRQLETILGFPFFQSHVVEIDYAKRRVRVFDADAEWQPKGESLPLRFVHNVPHIDAALSVGDSVDAVDAVVDTGASGSGVTAKYMKGRTLNVASTPKTVIGGGVGGFIEGRWFRPSFVRLGTTALAKPVLSMSESERGMSGAKAPNEILIGADLLRRFRVTFDYARKRMFLEPIEDFAKPFEFDRSGLRVHAKGTDARAFTVVGVLTGSASDEAGIQVGDVIESIDGTPTSKLTLQELRERFRSTAAKQWELATRRGDQTRTVTVTAKSII